MVRSRNVGQTWDSIIPTLKNTRLGIGIAQFRGTKESSFLSANSFPNRCPATQTNIDFPKLASNLCPKMCPSYNCKSGVHMNKNPTPVLISLAPLLQTAFSCDILSRGMSRVSPQLIIRHCHHAHSELYLSLCPYRGHLFLFLPLAVYYYPIPSPL